MMEKPINSGSGSGQAHDPFADSVNDLAGGNDVELLKNLAALPRSIQPANDPWQQIASRIANEQAGFGKSGKSGKRSWIAHSGKGWLALAASLMMAVISYVFVSNGNDFAEPELQPLAIQSEPGLMLNEQGARVPVTSIELEYQAAFREFSTLKYTPVPAAQAAAPEILQDWELMRQLESELRLALEQEPDNSFLLQKLISLRARQLQLLHLIADSGRLPGGNLI
jgi:hypothetical protein